MKRLFGTSPIPTVLALPAACAAIMAVAVPSLARGMLPLVYEVDRTDDLPTGACTVAANDCSLRAAISAANNDGLDSRIILADEIYQLVLPGADEDGNITGDLDIKAALEIMVAIGARPVIEQTVADRVLHVTFGAGNVRIVGPLTITGGRVVGLSPGGGIHANQNGDLELEDVTLTDNQAESVGGCLAYDGSMSVSLNRVTLSDCHSQNYGGGAGLLISGSSATITSSLIENNTSYVRGGGLHVRGGANVVVLDTTIRGNLTGHLSSTDALGGGFYMSQGNGVLRQSTVSGNQAGVPSTTVAAGGGVYVESSTSFLFENSTVSGNRADGVGEGAGIRTSGTPVTLDHTTVVDNPTEGMHAIYFVSGGMTLTSKNSIIDGGCSGNTGSIVSSGFNVERPWDGSTNTTCNLTNPSDLAVTDLMLRPLLAYGGPTDTHALLAGSPAQGLVNSSQCQNEDQRHAVRQGLFCDSGSYDDSSDPPGPGLFADGFESGNTAAWSTTVP